ncbi:protein mono-ADP-ribosyltransferase PARP14-like [Dendronephthya gigantea]|uniref:protein mono-ADP-ribosyltransferase PARP14-like n=1 Tax=Dendronephthya gigantea TaxID=151771 RepID=UPI00106BE24D|nr:protein mono-ADP-ribosyltransferase PARP14-like [Dendronephthya gigantea]
MDECESSVIEVTGISSTTSKENLENFFSSRKRGGDIVKIEYTEGDDHAFITFANAEGANKALEESPHSMGQCTLVARKKKAKVWEKNKILVEGISTTTTRDGLMFYLERISDLEVKEMIYGTRSNQTVNAIVTFESSIDFDKIQEGLRKKSSLDGKQISIKTVPLCSTILVKNLPSSATHDSVLYKFENKRVGGGEVKRVELDLEKKIALVEFKDPSVINNVLSISQTLDNTILTVEHYYPILGSLTDLQSETTEEDGIRNSTSLVETTPKQERPKAAGFVTAIDSDLYHYLKQNHPAQLSHALREPQPSIETKGDSVHFSFSSEETKEHFLTDMKAFKYEIVPINPTLLEQGLEKELQEIFSVFSVAKSVSFIERYGEGFLKLVGRAVVTFDKAHEEVRKCIAKVEKRTNRCDDSIQLLPVHLKLLQHSTKFQRLENSLKRDGLEIIQDETTGRINVKGSPTQIQQLKSETQEIVGLFEERSLNGNRFSLLKANKAISHVKSLLTAENSTVEVVVDDKGMVTLYGMQKTHVDKAFDIIVNAMVEIKLPEGLRTKSSQDALLNELGTSTPLSLQREDGVPRIVCFKKHLRNLNAKVDDFKERKKTVEQRVRLQKAVLRYLSTYGETTLEGLRLSSPGLKIEIGSEALVLSGEKPLVENCCVSIQDLTKDLKVEKMDYGTPETASSIKGMAYMAIESIERKHRCGIAVTINDQPERQISFRSQNATTVSIKEDRKRTMQCRYTFPNGKIIEVHQGDILEHPVDYLVNSANEELKHAGGLARAIVEKGGRKIQEDCFRALNELGTAKLLLAEVIPTDGGKLMCKEILHVVVPTYRPSDGYGEGETREEWYLRHCCTNVLEKATKGQTIAIPALGTGIYRIPYDISAKSLVAATCEFLQEKPSHSLQQVHFVDNEPSAIEALMKEIVGRFSCDSNLHINEPVRDRWRPLLGASGGVSPLDTTKACDHFTFKTPEGMEVHLTIGNVAKSTTDVIVNTVGSDLNLTKNPCSKAILDEAGSGLKSLCEKWIKDKHQLKERDFAITDGAKLKCKKVFHVSCPRWTADQGEKQLREVVQKLLCKTAALSLTSISMPALGTGTLGFPVKLVAKILFEEATQFSSDHKPSPKIKTVNVVVYKGNKTAVDAFKEQFQGFSPTADVNARKTKRGSESGAGILKTTRKKISGAFDRSSGKEKDKTHGVEVEIVQGNIVEESTDAIGFLVAEDITQGGQIGRALYRGAGEDLRKEYINIGLNRIDPGTVVMTTAGNLKVCKLLHMVIKAPTDKSTIQNAVTRCLNDADMYGFASLSLPAVGTGHLQRDGKQSAEILYHCIKEYRKRDNKSLKLIRIVILQENVFEEFRGAFARKDPGAESSKGSTRKTRQQITLEIAAESSSDIAAIKKELKRVEEEQCHTETIETQQEIDVRQLEKIMEIQDLHDVRIECKPTIGYIRISGLARNVSIAVGKIHNIIHDWERERHHTDVTVREVEWFYYEGDKGVVIPEKYAKQISAKIETAYKRNPSGTVEVGDDEKYKIDFKTMTETCLTSNEGLMKVYRRPCEAFPFPKNWEYQPIDGSTGQELQVFRFNIEKQDTEYDEIHDKFLASLSLAANVPNVEVVKIERIQNPGLYQLYQGKKKKMCNDGNELDLYHGTTKDAVEKINCTGFNRSYCGKNAVKFGNGVYFAREAWYSSRRQYAVPDEKGLQYMYIAKVLVGKYTKGKEGLIVPPPIDASNPNVSYDSVVDNVAKPLIYVVFYDYQHYPEYLITFKCS